MTTTPIPINTFITIPFSKSDKGRLLRSQDERKLKKSLENWNVIIYHLPLMYSYIVLLNNPMLTIKLH